MIITRRNAALSICDRASAFTESGVKRHEQYGIGCDLSCLLRGERNRSGKGMPYVMAILDDIVTSVTALPAVIPESTEADPTVSS